MPSDLSLSELCGQLIICGFASATVPRELARDLQAALLGGVILFKRNLPSVEAAHEIVRSVVDASPDDLPPFVGVDQEGGRVTRLLPPVLRLPPMRTLGEIGDPDLVRRTAALVGRELAAIGFNVNFAPVLDVDSNPKNPVIGDRAFSSDPSAVARLGCAYIDGLQSAGVMACGKHFPGHGDTAKDSHTDLPVVTRGKQRLDEVELLPFRAATRSGVSALMTAHVVHQELDAGVPATLSHAICTRLLRVELGFSGVLISDDLEMRALSDRYSIEQSAVGAVRAGADALLVCSDLELAARAHEALVIAAEQDDALRRRCSEAAARVLAARRRFPPRPLSSAQALQGVIGGGEARALLEEIEARSARRA